MTDSVSRFSHRAQNYLKYRPHYPVGMLPYLQDKIGLSPQWTVVDVGSGTGFLTEIFLQHGNEVIGVEPNADMRMAAEEYLAAYPRFVSQNGRAEATGLPPGVAELITAGQAFHWFDPVTARQEFRRILRPPYWTLLVWNTRRLDSTPFLSAYETLLRMLATDYAQTNEQNITDEKIAAFYGGAEHFTVSRFENIQHLDWTQLKGRVLSSSYVPLPDHPNYAPFVDQLRRIFAQHEQDGRIAFEYDTRLYYGQLNIMNYTEGRYDY